MKTIRTIKREAKAALKGHWGIAIGILIIMYLITGALNLVAPTENNYDSTAIVLSILSVLIAVFVTLSISTGFVWFYLRLFDGESLKVVNLFDAFKKRYVLESNLGQHFNRAVANYVVFTNDYFSDCYKYCSGS